MNLPNGGDKQVINDGNKAPSNHHHYDLSYKFAVSERFGECNPFVFCYGVPDDENVTFRTKHELRTTALASPLLQNMRKNLDYYAVPTKAILPHTWDFIQNNPVIGDDIDARLLNCLMFISGEADNLSGLKDLLYSAFSNAGVLNSGVKFSTYTLSDWAKFVYLLTVLETFFAKDSLLASFRMPLHKRLGVFASNVIKDTLLQAWTFYHDFLKRLAVDYPSLKVNFLDSNSQPVLSRTYQFADLVDRMRFYFDFIEIPFVDWEAEDSISDATITTIYDDVVEQDDFSYLDRDLALGFIANVPLSNTTPIDIRPLLAYQLIIAEYFTNDKIDYVYSADMLRKVYEGAFISVLGESFVLNGNSYPYDGFSAKAISLFFELAKGVFASDSITATSSYHFSLLLNLFTKKRSLRFVDYFTGARSHPIAVGDVNVQVDASGVSAIDMTKGIQTARYLLAVNRVGPKAKEYLKGIFGANERTRNDVPVKVGHIDSVIYGIETQNTGEAQIDNAQSITTNLTTRSEDYAFQMDLAEDTLFIGIASYEIARFYTEGWSKFAGKVDRFDYFNPYFQYTGDQPIKQSELNAGLSDDAIFGYQSKDMEYKLQTDYAAGDFLGALRGWIFAQEEIKDDIEISPDFIRAHQTELDRYFIAMTGLMASERYHFISMYDNKIEASRNMVFDPQILK